MSNEESSFITPVIAAEDIYEGNAPAAFEDTAPGTYRMALTAGLRVKKTKAGQRKLDVFFKHADAANAGKNGVRGSAMLEGIDKNGRSMARQFGDLLNALGVAKEDITGGKASVALLSSFESLPEAEQWKGVPAAITINGDVIDLTGRECIVKVVASTYNGKTTIKADGFYPVR